MKDTKYKTTTKYIWSGMFLALFGLVALGSTGCTTYTAGMTLPNPHYHKNIPQYHARGVEYPFPNEAASLQEAERTLQHGR